jgi:hypothetical protein
MNRVTKIVASFFLAIALMFAAVAPANATQWGSCSVGGATYNSQISFSRPGGGTVRFDNWSITGPTPMEYRVRWYGQGQLANPIYDTGYINGATSAQGFPGVSRYLPNTTTFVLVNAGRAFDGYATCETVPNPFQVPGA